jgi:hypothetical protein
LGVVGLSPKNQRTTTTEVAEAWVSINLTFDSAQLLLKCLLKRLVNPKTAKTQNLIHKKSCVPYIKKLCSLRVSAEPVLSDWGVISFDDFVDS